MADTLSEGSGGGSRLPYRTWAAGVDQHSTDQATDDPAQQAAAKAWRRFVAAWKHCRRIKPPRYGAGAGNGGSVASVQRRSGRNP